jgi:hypothetical protein
MNLARFVTAPIMKWLAIALAASIAANAIQVLYVWGLRHERDALTLQNSAALSANRSNMETIRELRAANEQMAGEEQNIALLTEAAETVRALATAASSDRAAAERARRAQALKSPSCRANAELPVCPGLVGAE